jgi:hypothetical protein
MRHEIPDNSASSILSMTYTLERSGRPIPLMYVRGSYCLADYLLAILVFALVALLVVALDLFSFRG